MRPTEMDLSSSRLDQVFHSGEPAKAFILSPRRTGSFMLCRMMLAAGLGVPHEYFNPLHINIIGSRVGIAGSNDALRMQADPTVLQNYVKFLKAFRTRGGLFAAKLQYHQFHLHLQNATGHRLLDGAFLIYLSREDLLRQAVSLRYAQVTGMWGFETARMTAPAREQDVFDIAALDQVVDDLILERLVWERFFARNALRPLRVSYEQLCRSPDDVLRSIAEGCGFDPQSVPLGRREGAAYRAPPGLPPKSAVYEFYLRSRRVVRPRITAPGRPVRSLADVSAARLATQ